MMSYHIADNFPPQHISEALGSVHDLAPFLRHPYASSEVHGPDDLVTLRPFQQLPRLCQSSSIQKGFFVRPAHAARFLRLAFALAFGLVAFRAAADSPVPQAPLALTDANLASVIDPLMTNWIDKRKGPGAVVVVVKRDATVFAKGYGFSDIEAK